MEYAFYPENTIAFAGKGERVVENFQVCLPHWGFSYNSYKLQLTISHSTTIYVTIIEARNHWST